MFKYDGFRFIQKVINNYRYVINTSLIDGVPSHNKPKECYQTRNQKEGEI